MSWLRDAMGAASVSRPGGPASPVSWPRRARAERAATPYLLDLDVDLAEALDVRMRMAVAPARHRARSCRWGWATATCPAGSTRPPGPGLLVLDGVLAFNAASATGSPPSCSAPATCSSRPSGPTTSCWPARLQLAGAGADALRGARRGVRRTGAAVAADRAGAAAAGPSAAPRNLNVQRAIACQPRLDVRLALLLWHLAARWGRVEPRRHPAAAAAHPPAAGSARRRRATVGVARALASGPRGPGHRSRRRMASARQHRGPSGVDDRSVDGPRGRSVLDAASVPAETGWRGSSSARGPRAPRLSRSTWCG